MSDKVEIVSTEFKNLSTGEVSYGFRIYDDCEALYCNTFETNVMDDLQLLAEVIALEDPHMDGLLDYVEGHGCSINDVWYDAEQLADVFLAATKGEPKDDQDS